jgi:hypothetical protein
VGHLSKVCHKPKVLIIYFVSRVVPLWPDKMDDLIRCGGLKSGLIRGVTLSDVVASNLA